MFQVNMEVSLTHQCDCRPGFMYKNMAQHKKTKMHQAWETSLEVKDVRGRSKHFENEIERLRHTIEHKEAVEKILSARIVQLLEEIESLKNLNCLSVNGQVRPAS